MAVESVWIPASLVPGLEPADLDGSLYELLARRYGIVTGAASVTIEPMLPDAETRAQLAIPDDQACLRLRMVDSDARGRVVMAADCVYRGDRYQLSANVSGAAFSSHDRPAGRLMRVLAVDGGQSGIRLRGSDDPRTVEVAGVGRLEGDTVAQLADGVARAWREAAFGQPDRVVLGLTTAPSERTAAERLGRLVAATTGAREVWVADDAVTAHAGALSGGWGVSLVAGTGVACLALPDGGEPRILGGHGFLLGDEGGGFWIGRLRPRAPCCGRARGVAPTPAWRPRRGAASATSTTSTCASTTRRARSPRSPRSRPTCSRRPAAGDEVARAIVDEAADELADHGRRGRRLGGEREPVAVPVALGGRLLLEPTAAADGASRRGSAARTRRSPCGSRTGRRSTARCASAWATTPGRTPRSSPWSRRRDRA